MASAGNFNSLCVFLLAFQLVRANDFNNPDNVYAWSENQRDYVSYGKRLNVSALDEFSNSHMVTQCAYRCLRNRECAAYNYMKSSATCQLLSESHITHPHAVIDDIESRYYEKNAYSIDAVSS